MSIRSLGLVTGLMALSAVPLAAHAAGSEKAADACIQAFVDTYLPKDRQVQVRKLWPVPGPLGAYTKKYTIELSARLSRSGTELVTARCVASANGEVLALDSPKTDMPLASTSVSKLK